MPPIAEEPPARPQLVGLALALGGPLSSRGTAVTANQVGYGVAANALPPVLYSIGVWLVHPCLLACLLVQLVL
jgi:hypothetical protein